MNSVSAVQVKAKRLVLYQHLKSNHMGCIVEARLRAVSLQGGPEWWKSNMVKSNVRSLANKPGDLVNELEETCEAFQEQFTRFFRESGGPESRGPYRTSPLGSCLFRGRMRRAMKDRFFLRGH